MKTWTHRVLCEEFSKTHGLHYPVFATLCADGEYRLAERRFARDMAGMFPYGLVLTNVRVEETRAQHDKRRSSAY